MITPTTQMFAVTLPTSKVDFNVSNRPEIGVWLQGGHKKSFSRARNYRMLADFKAAGQHCAVTSRVGGSRRWTVPEQGASVSPRDESNLYAVDCRQQARNVS